MSVTVLQYQRYDGFKTVCILEIVTSVIPMCIVCHSLKGDQLRISGLIVYVKHVFDLGQDK